MKSLLLILIKEELNKYINSFYNHKPNLPALKDEFRKAGVV
jgi:hypothetical protein